MDKQKVLRIYLEQFHKVVVDWAKSAPDYSLRHKKVRFSEVIGDMNRFARRYLGEGNYMAYNDDLVYYLMKHGYILRDERGQYDVTEEKFNEYREMRPF